MSSTDPISASPGLTTSSTKVRTRVRMSSSSGVRVKSMLMGASAFRDDGVGAGEQPEGGGVEQVAGGFGGLAGAGPGVRALEHDAELEAGHGGVPVHGRRVAVGVGGVAGDQLGRGGQAGDAAADAAE